jgi:transposase
MEDETILRLFPVLRRAWSLRGQQALVQMTGGNAKRVLFATLNLRTGHRICLRGRDMKQANFQALLREVRLRYQKRPVWMLLDEAKCHIAEKSQALAAMLDIHLLWLPKQCSELNSIDQLWKELKGKVSANYQYASIDQHADHAEKWLLTLTDKEALRKAGVLSKNFWLQSFLP